MASNRTRNWRRGIWTPLAKRNGQSESFARLIIGDLIRNHEDRVIGRATRERIQCVTEFVHTGKKLPASTQQTICRMIMDTSFFVAEKGAIGLGSKGTKTKPCDEVRIFCGSNMPFTVRKREGGNGKNEVDHGFGGRCYVQGIMFGEIFMEELRVPLERQVRLQWSAVFAPNYGTISAILSTRYIL